MNSRTTLDEVRRLAAEAGLDRLDESHLQQLRKATESARARRAALPASDLAPGDEPAHVFRLARRGASR